MGDKGDNGLMSHDLQRFLDAQDSGGTYERALAELRAGRKTTHWMWFVFPQRAGLGQSEMSRRYAIGSPAEARAYVEHPVLGPRLVTCAETLLTYEDKSAREILGEIDAAKLRSSITLFAAVAPEQPAFEQVLDRYFDGEPDESTARWL
jgi:uncharacterized protein (DUF1810 family)